MILAMVSKKGGVGKTTSAVSLSAALAAEGYRVLLVDLDSQASASLSLGLPRDQLAPSLADVLLHGLPALQALRPTATPGLHLITASVDLLSAESELGVFSRPELILGRTLEPLEHHFDFILLDSPPSVSLLPTSALAACHAFVVPVMPHYLALAGVEGLLQYAERLRHRLRQPERTRLLGILLTVVDYRNRATHDNVARIRKEYGRQVFAIEVRVNVRLAEAPEHGQSIFEFDPASTGAACYQLLAEEVVMRVEALRREPAVVAT